MKWVRMQRHLNNFRIAQRTRVNAVLTLIMLCAVSATSTAAPSVYTQRDANGQLIFSDAPIENGEMVRTSYQAQYGRPVATASCQGMTESKLSARANALTQTIESAAVTHKVDANLLRAIAQIESCFDQQAVSKVGAQGVMQLMPATAKELGVTDSFNAAQNINGGARYIAKMLKRFNHNHQLALAAYNAGPGAVEKHQGIPPYPETQNYVKKVLQLYAASEKQKS